MIWVEVVNRREHPFDVYIGRPSKWGNPFVIGKDGNREQVIEKYRELILNQPKLMRELYELQNKILGCWCKPKACHGDILKELVERLPQENTLEVGSIE